jgi:hypothetical protein
MASGCSLGSRRTVSYIPLWLDGSASLSVALCLFTLALLHVRWQQGSLASLSQPEMQQPYVSCRLAFISHYFRTTNFESCALLLCYCLWQSPICQMLGVVSSDIPTLYNRTKKKTQNTLLMTLWTSTTDDRLKTRIISSTLSATFFLSSFHDDQFFRLYVFNSFLPLPCLNHYQPGHDFCKYQIYRILSDFIDRLFVWQILCLSFIHSL